MKHRSLRVETLEQRALLTAATAGDFATLKQLAESGQRYEIALTADIVVGGDDMIAVAGNISIDGRQVVDGVETVHSITVAFGTDRTCSFMTVSYGSLTLSNLTISGFNYVGGYGGVFQQTGGTITIDSGTTISNCGAYNGAVADIDRGTFIVSGATFSNNTAANDGGVFDLEIGTLIINSGTFSNNTAVDDGGVVYADTRIAEVTINDGLFTGNSAYIGGVAYLNSGKITIKAGRVLGNSASFEGGVVSTTTSFSELTIDDGVFTGNTAAKGGVACFSAGTVTINNGT
ncbi:MAG: hypothetical protein J6S27_05555, partial [Thermoguttaceae bacterium]|nr:hypothetical protein [Thermoguttaceae bacterium]